MTRTLILAASEPASKNTSEYVGLIVNGGKEPKLKNETVEWSRTRFPPCRPYWKRVWAKNFIGPKNQEQVYLELVFAADHDAVIVESI